MARFCPSPSNCYSPTAAPAVPHPYDQSHPGLGFSHYVFSTLLNCSRIICAGSFKHCLTLQGLLDLLSISLTGLCSRSYGPFLLLPCLAVMSSRTWPRYSTTIHVLFSNSLFLQLFTCSPSTHTYHSHQTVLLNNVTLFPLITTLIPSVETLDKRPRELVCTEKEELRRGPEKKVKGPRETTTDYSRPSLHG